MIIWKISSQDEIIITQPGWNFISPCHCFQYRKQITITCKKVNISSRLADPELKLSPYNPNFSFIPGWKQKIPFIQKLIFIKTKMKLDFIRDETSHIIVKISTRQTRLKFHPGMKNLHIISPLIIIGWAW